MISHVFNEDNMIGMARYPDKFFDLAIVDPPYGIGEDGESNHSRSKIAAAQKYTPKTWDKEPSTIEFFNELRRISKNQIIWGANHFICRIPFDSPCWIVWDKDNSGDFADCELAWTSFKTAVRKFKWRWNGMLQERMSEKEKRIHPTQKPVPLYKWLLKTYAQPGDKILDTHMGSQSSRIATHQMGFDYWGWEIDKDYFEAGNKRFSEQTIQQSLFTPK
jgi:site-specific DNA-methyltransferase (adenine-specific)